MLKKSAVICLLGFFLVISVYDVFAVSGTKEWETFWGSESVVAVISVDTDSQGNIIAAGPFGEGETRYANLLKYDKGGTFAWNVKNPFNRTDWYDMVIGSNDNIITSGWKNNNSWRWHVVAKFDSSGNELWNMTSGKYNWPGLYGGGDAVDVYPNGDIVMGTYNYSTRYNIKAMELYKYDSNGNLFWSYTYDYKPITYDYPYDLKIDSSGNIFVLANTNDTDGAEILLLKIDTNGNLIWNKSFGYSGLEIQAFSGQGLALDSAGNIYFAAYDYNTYLPMVVKMDTDGNEIFNFSYIYDAPFDLGPFPTAIKIDSNGNIIIVGFDFDDDFYDRGIVSKFDNSGNEIWHEHNSVQYYNMEYLSVEVDSDNNIIIGGDNYTDYPAPASALVLKYSDGIPKWGKFQGIGSTTDLNNAADLASVPNFILDSGSTFVAWDNNVNVSSQDLDSFINMGDHYVSFNMSQLDSSFNASATVVMPDVNCLGFILYYSTGFHTSANDFITSGTKVATYNNIGGNCNDPSICTDVSCTNGVLTFNAQHFDGFGEQNTQNQIPEFSDFTLILALVIVIGGFVCIRKAKHL